MLELNTFSIAARCARTGMFGVAVSTAVPGVGGICPFMRAGRRRGIHPVLGQSLSRHRRRQRCSREGLSAEAALEKLIADDPGRDVRQVGLVDRNGRSAAWSGKDCTTWFGHITGADYAVQGNMLVGEPTIQAMAEAFEQCRRRWSCRATADRCSRPVRRRAATSAAASRRRSRSCTRRNIPISTCGSTSTATRSPSCGACSRSPATSICRSSSACRPAPDPLGNLPEQVGAMLLTPPPYRPGGGGSV